MQLSPTPILDHHTNILGGDSCKAPPGKNIFTKAPVGNQGNIETKLFSSKDAPKATSAQPGNSNSRSVPAAEYPGKL